MSPPLIHFLGHSRRSCQRKGAVRGQRTDRGEVAEGDRAEKPGVTEAWPCSLCSSGESRCYFHPWPSLPTARVRPACSALSQSWPLTPSSAIGGTQKDDRTRSMSFRWWTQAWPSPHTPGSGVFSHWQSSSVENLVPTCKWHAEFQVPGDLPRSRMGHVQQLGAHSRATWESCENIDG